MAATEKDRTKIPEPNYSILRKQYDFIITQIDPKHLESYLFSEFILDDIDLENIDAAKDKHGKTASAKKFMEILLNSGSRAYDVFLKCLNEKGYSSVAETIKKTKIEPLPDPYEWIDQLPEELKNQQVTEPYLARISGYFGAGWETILSKLGNKQSQIDQDKQNHKFSTQNAILTSLNRWMQRKASDATVLTLLNTMKSCSQTTIEWDSMKQTTEELVKNE